MLFNTQHKNIITNKSPRPDDINNDPTDHRRPQAAPAGGPPICNGSSRAGTRAGTRAARDIPYRRDGLPGPLGLPRRPDLHGVGRLASARTHSASGRQGGRGRVGMEPLVRRNARRSPSSGMVAVGHGHLQAPPRCILLGSPGSCHPHRPATGFRLPFILRI